MCNIAHGQILLTGDTRVLLAAQALRNYAVPLLQSSRQSKQQICLDAPKNSDITGTSMSADRPVCFLTANSVVFVLFKPLLCYCILKPIVMQTAINNINSNIDMPEKM